MAPRTKKRNWIAKATAKMRRKGTLGSFGKATKKKIARAKKQGGKMAKKAIFAQNMARISRRNAARRSSSRRRR